MSDSRLAIFRWTIALDASGRRGEEREKQQPKIIKLVVTDPDTLENGGIIPASSSSLSLLRTRHFLE